VINPHHGAFVVSGLSRQRIKILGGYCDEKKARHNTILIDGIRYYAEKPETCRMCFFGENRKVGCILGKQNCYYLAEAVMTEQEKKCEGCCYAKDLSYVSAACYKDLDAWLRAKRVRKRRWHR